MWRDDVNAAGGILGRNVELVVYDDQSNPGLIPGIYAKLINLDKVDLLLLPYATNTSAVVMPMIKQQNRFVLGQFEIGQNDKLMHDKFFEIAPWGPKPGDNWCRGYFDLAKRLGYKTLAIVNSDAEFSANAAGAGKKIAEEYGLKVLTSQNYPPNSVDFSGILRNVNAAKPDFVFAASYPVESAAMIRGISEIGISESIQMFGGAMVGIHTIVGPVKFGADGNWIESRIVWGQYRGVQDKDIDQFRTAGKQIVVQPEALATGKVITPYKTARA
jgi:branched-chain amino acid transport system substrate-binding protein